MEKRGRPPAGEPSPRAKVIEGIHQWIEDGECKPGDPIPAERKIAERLGVSQRTVQVAMQVLLKQGIIKQHTPRTRTVALDPTPKPEPPERLSKTVLCLSCYGSLFTLDYNKVKGLEHEALVHALKSVSYNNLQVTTAYSKNFDALDIKNMLACPPAAVLTTANSLSRSNVSSFLNEKSPFPVILYGYRNNLPFDAIASDHTAGGKLIAEKLLEQGHKNIIHVINDIGAPGPIPQRQWLDHRYEGYCLAMKEASMTPRPIVNLAHYDRPIKNKEELDHAIRINAGYLIEYLNGPDPVDAIMCASDSGVAVIAAACRLVGREPGKDIVITGYDNIWDYRPKLDTYKPHLTVDKQEPEIGQALAELIVGRINNTLPEEKIETLIQPVLIEN